MISVAWDGGVVVWNGPDDVEIYADEFDAATVEQALARPARVFRSDVETLKQGDVLVISEIVTELPADGSPEHARAALLQLDGAKLLDTSE